MILAIPAETLVLRSTTLELKTLPSKNTNSTCQCSHGCKSSFHTDCTLYKRSYAYLCILSCFFANHRFFFHFQILCRIYTKLLLVKHLKTYNKKISFAQGPDKTQDKDFPGLLLFFLSLINEAHTDPVTVHNYMEQR